MDKRKYRRLECSFPVKVRKIPSQDAQKFEYFTITNLGPEGAFLKGENIFDQETLLELEFSLQDNPSTEETQEEKAETITATGIVRWKKENKENSGMGVQFLKVSEFGKQKISVYIIRKILELRQGKKEQKL
ncbi:MAG: PilZ domain-containing protein [Planctomycetota bacterium]|nr:MAG: PilZ domain-containing protein [Planctomycetota bacterium]